VVLLAQPAQCRSGTALRRKKQALAAKLIKFCFWFARLLVQGDDYTVTQLITPCQVERCRASHRLIGHADA
jgi:hypothetical protein